MTLALAFAIVSALALGFHLLNLRDAWLDLGAIRVAKVNGEIRSLAWMLVRTEAIRGSKALILLLVGLGALAGLRWIGYLILAIPVLSLAASALDLHTRRHQTQRGK